MAETSANREIELRRANEYRGRMLAIAGHDLRQPLQIIAMSHDLIGRSVNDGKARKHLARAERAVERLTHQLDLITMAGRLDGQALQPRLEALPVGPLIAEIAAEQIAMAEASGLELRVVASSATIMADREMLATILRISSATRSNIPGAAACWSAAAGGRTAWPSRFATPASAFGKTC